MKKCDDKVDFFSVIHFFTDMTVISKFNKILTANYSLQWKLMNPFASLKFDWSQCYESFIKLGIFEH